MDVTLSGPRIFFFLFLTCLGFYSCGNRFDIETKRGQQSRIDQANFYLSRGECQAALDAIDELYNSAHVTDEIRIIEASAYACKGGFNLLTFMSNIASSSNTFGGMVKSLSSTTGDGTRTNFYSSMDVMTGSGARLSASQRTSKENTFMVFLQMGVISSILRNYGAPDPAGGQTAALVYDAGANPAGEMSNVDACALTGAIAIMVDSFSGSSLNDASTSAVLNSMNDVCVAAGLASCAVLNKDRALCDGTNANSIAADGVVDGVDAAW
jgi:hypothetical protein